MDPYEINNLMNTYLASNWTKTNIRKIGESQPDIPYIESHLLPAPNVSIEIQRAFESSGVFMINIFIENGVGVDQGWDFAKKLEALFINQKTGDLYFEKDDIKPYSKHVGIDEKLQARHFQVVVPYSIIGEV